MIEKMKYINLMGPITQIDRIVEQYLLRYEIQLEYTMKELSNEKGLTAFTETNLYAPILRRAESLAGMTGLNPEDYTGDGMTKEDALRVIDTAETYLKNLSNELNRLKARRTARIEALEKLSPFRSLVFDVEQFTEFRFIQYQFGRMPMGSFKQFEAFLYDDSEILFLKGKSDADYIWCVYFVPESQRDKVDSMFSSLHFEKSDWPMAVEGEPLIGNVADVCDDLAAQIAALNEEIDAYEKSMLAAAEAQAEADFTRVDIMRACAYLRVLSQCFETRKYAARTENGFFIFVGWMIAKDAAKIAKDTESDDAAVLLIEEQNESIPSRPPTKLRNPWFIRPFEFFVRMYGLPAYDELDPTPFVALTYTVLFGIMFADVGQGLLVSLLGLFLWKKKGMALGAIMGVIGLSSMIFGTLFGSVFGNEEILPALWMHPAEGAHINSTLLYAVGFGVMLILVSMGFHIANAVRRRRVLHAAMEPNGLAGLMFYITVLLAAGLVMLGQTKIVWWLVGICVGLPLLAMMFRQPLLNLLKGRKKLIHGGVGLFLFESVIEMFEVLLGYFSNTVSFLRVGAFALSHASIMGVVWTLSQAANGTHNMLVIIFGNLLVIALEGLIAGIQVLRLQFYEMFSRFYDGDGRAFVPYADTMRKAK